MSTRRLIYHPAQPLLITFRRALRPGASTFSVSVSAAKDIHRRVKTAAKPGLLLVKGPQDASTASISLPDSSFTGSGNLRTMSTISAESSASSADP